MTPSEIERAQGLLKTARAVVEVHRELKPASGVRLALVALEVGGIRDGAMHAVALVEEETARRVIRVAARLVMDELEAMGLTAPEEETDGLET